MSHVCIWNEDDGLGRLWIHGLPVGHTFAKPIDVENVCVDAGNLVFYYEGRRSGFVARDMYTTFEVLRRKEDE